jgi:hypothetical protein
MRYNVTRRWQFLIGCLLISTVANAEEPASRSDSPLLEQYAHVWADPGGRFQILTDEILPTSRPRFEGLLALPEYHQWKRELSSKHGLDYVIVSAPISQVGSVDSKAYVDNEIDVLANWRLIETPERQSELYFWGLWVHTFTDLPTGAFSESQGLISGPNGGGTDPDKDFVGISALFWQETFKREFGDISYRIGHLHASSTWATLDYLSDDRAYFMATPLSSPQGGNWVDSNRGLGAVAAFDAGSWYVSAGFSDAKGSQKHPDPESFSDGKFKYIAEIGFYPTLWGRPGEYKITPSYTDRTGNTDAPGDRAGWGLILTARQAVADNVNVFAQYRHSWDRAVGGFDRLLTTGLMVDPPFGWTDDLMGVGVFYGHPIDLLDRDEYGIEAFYRLQLTHRLDVTPDIQIYRAGRATRTDDTVVVAGLRLRVVF